MAAPAFQIFHVSDAGAGQTLASQLRQSLAGQSWRQIQRLLQARHVQVNGNLCCDAGRRLKTGDVVKVWAHSLAKPVDESDVRICYLDEQIVVVEKPAGITTLRHPEERNWSPRRRQLQPTLEELVTQLIARKARRRKGAQRRPSRVRPVHRLDRDTSGLMVFARTIPAERNLVQQFSQHQVKRKYVAIVHGHVQARTIESYLTRDRGDGRRGSTTEPSRGKRAVTHVRPIETLGHYTVVECRLETGRTHQIRIHLAEQGHMLCGEKVYCRPLRGEPTKDRSGAPRQALHAKELEFRHPTTGELMRFSYALPRDLAEFLARLRRECGKQASAPRQRDGSD